MADKKKRRRSLRISQTDGAIKELGESNYGSTWTDASPNLLGDLYNKKCRRSKLFTDEELPASTLEDITLPSPCLRVNKKNRRRSKLFTIDDHLTFTKDPLQEGPKVNPHSVMKDPLQEVPKDVCLNNSVSILKSLPNVEIPRSPDHNASLSDVKGVTPVSLSQESPSNIASSFDIRVVAPVSLSQESPAPKLTSPSIYHSCTSTPIVRSDPEKSDIYSTPSAVSDRTLLRLSESIPYSPSQPVWDIFSPLKSCIKSLSEDSPIVSPSVEAPYQNISSRTGIIPPKKHSNKFSGLFTPATDTECDANTLCSESENTMADVETDLITRSPPQIKDLDVGIDDNYSPSQPSTAKLDSAEKNVMETSSSPQPECKEKLLPKIYSEFLLQSVSVKSDSENNGLPASNRPVEFTDVKSNNEFSKKLNTDSVTQSSVGNHDVSLEKPGLTDYTILNRTKISGPDVVNEIPKNVTLVTDSLEPDFINNFSQSLSSRSIEESVNEISCSATDDVNDLPKKRGRSRKKSDSTSPQAESDIGCQNIEDECLTARRSSRLRRRSLEIYRAAIGKTETKSPKTSTIYEEPEEKVTQVESDDNVSETDSKVLKDVNGRKGNGTVKPSRKRKLKDTDIEKIYTEKNYVPPAQKGLETILECSSKTSLGRKYKRLIDFGNLYYQPPIKQKKRVQKAMKRGYNQRILKKNKIPDEVFSQNLQKIWDELDSQTELNS